MRWSDDFSLPENGGHLEKATDSKSDWGIPNPIGEFQIRYKLPSKRNNKYEENTDIFNRDGKLCCFLGGSDRF